MDNSLTITCYYCKSNMVIRHGKYGYFWGCSNFPNCHNSENAEPIEGKCPVCNGELKDAIGRIEDEYTEVQGVYCYKDNYFYTNLVTTIYGEPEEPF